MKTTIFTAVVLLTWHSYGQSPRLLSFQGRLTDSHGESVPNGAKLIQFQIYEEPTGGGALWAGEVHRTTVNGGLVNVLLGSKNPLPLNRLNDPDRSFFDGTLYLQITVDGNDDGQISIADPPLLPRQAILPTMFAIESAVARDSQKLGGFNWSALLTEGNPLTGKLPGQRISAASISANQIAPRAIGSSLVAASAIQTEHIALGSVALDSLAALVVQRLVPTGSILAFGGGSSRLPQGWLLCDGSAISRVTYSNLFTTLESAFGAGNGTSTFNLPDLRGRVIMGAGTGDGLSARSLGQKVGEETHKLTIAEMPSHSHQIRTVPDFDSGGGWSGSTWFGDPILRDTSAVGGSQPHNIMQPSLVINYIIKY